MSLNLVETRNGRIISKVKYENDNYFVEFQKFEEDVEIKIISKKITIPDINYFIKEKKAYLDFNQTYPREIWKDLADGIGNADDLISYIEDNLDELLKPIS